MRVAAVLILIVAGIVVGGATVVGAPIFALPVLAVLLAGWATVAIGRRALGRERPREPIRFTAEDRATMVPSPSPAQRAANRRRSAQDARSQRG
jgi:membrane protein DedA with SNARE-associated domain